MKQLFLLLVVIAVIPFNNFGQSAEEILQKSEDYLRGSTLIAEMQMTIERPKWTREMGMKIWSQGDEYSMIYLKKPKRDEGTTFLKRDKEIWNWVPSIERVVKMPPAMMMQSWMGSDFTNDDLVRSSSVVDDYDQEITGEVTLEERVCYEITLIPKPEAPVVWGKVISYISKEDFLQLKTEFYDEDDYLINTLVASNIKEMGGKTFPTKMTITPEEDPENKTIVEYLDIQFDKPIDPEFFSVSQMKRIRE